MLCAADLGLSGCPAGVACATGRQLILNGPVEGQVWPLPLQQLFIAMQIGD